MKRFVSFLLLATLAVSTIQGQQKKSLSRADSSRIEMEKTIRDATSDHYVVIAGGATDYIILKQDVQKLSEQSNIPYEDEGLIYDKMKGLIWPPDSSGHGDVYAGSYFMRRMGTDENGVNFLSLEMRDWYFNVPEKEKSLKLILVAGIFTNKPDAEERLKEVRKYRPAAYLRKIPIYMGCVH
jgi:hypothetical protein